jgi:hypothetical protein
MTQPASHAFARRSVPGRRPRRPRAIGWFDHAREMRAVAVLAICVSSVGLGACSSNPPGAERNRSTYLVFDDKGATPTFDIPDFTPGKGHLDYRAQISMFDIKTGKERWVELQHGAERGHGRSVRLDPPTLA